MAIKTPTKQVEGIEIANPAYDAAFKRLMENSRVASYFIESFIGEKIEDITMLPTENPMFKWSRKFEKFNMTSEEIERLKTLSVIRLDFVATIKTDSGEYKKVLIEIQKARDSSDVMRFRNYLAEHYKRKDSVRKKGIKASEPLPVITIYLLGFNLKETDEVVISVKRVLSSGITKKQLNIKIPFIEYLTHDSHIIQLARITGKMKTRIEKVLSVFEQRYFLDDTTKISKKYPHTTDDQVVCLMVEILEHVYADKDQRAEIELEWTSLEVLNSLVLDREKAIAKLQTEKVEDKKTIAEQDKTIAKLQIEKVEDKKTIVEQDKRIAELERLLKQVSSEDINI